MTNSEQIQAERTQMGAATAFIEYPTTSIRLTGGDRAKFLHNFTTNDIQRLEPGQGCEAFVCNVQGKTLGHVFAFCSEDNLTLLTEPGQAEILMPHLDKYLIREDVEISDISDSHRYIAVTGAGSTAAVQERFGNAPAGPCEIVVGKWHDTTVRIMQIDALGQPTFLIEIDPATTDQLMEEFENQSYHRLSTELSESLRIEAGYPKYGIDITDSNLPQELRRDETAISFHKGCYLGQETVARIDAMGHVNWHFVRIAMTTDTLPAPDTELTIDGKAVGRITSSAWATNSNQAIALGYVRHTHSSSGTSVDCTGTPATIL